MSLKPFVAVAVVALTACQAETFTSLGPTGLEVVHGPPPSVSLGTELDTLLQVRVVDADGHPQSNVQVSWRITAGDGEIIPASAQSGPDGLALARWKFGMVPGPKQVQVEIPGADPLTFSTVAHGFQLVQVTSGYTHGCGLDATGGAWCWNGDSVIRGAPGQYNDIRPTLVGGGHHFVEISAGDNYTCARTAAGEAWCWGYAYGGAFGPGISNQPAPVQIGGLPALSRLRTGLDRTCGIAAADSTTWCWGDSDAGQAGALGGPVGATQVTTQIKFVDLALGSAQSCGLTTAREVYCWGHGGELGDSGGSRTGPTTPVAGGHAFVEIKAGDANTCGRTDTGEVWCWGESEGGGGPRAIPVRIDLPAATSLAVGFDFIGVTTLGGGTRFAPFAGYELPAEIQGLGVAQLAGRGSYCLISRAGDVYCSGSIVDQGSCSSVSPYGCAPAGPIPLPAGGRVYGYPPFGD